MIKQTLRFKEVSSTQDIAKRLVNKNEELAVFAYRQKHGRGRQRRSWYSPIGGLYLSILLFPKGHINAIPLMVALAILKALEDLGFSKLSILWPNDVLLNDKKVCGILCEKYKNAIICGIGLNVNIKEFPGKLNNVTSLRIETGHEYSIEKILRSILKKIAPFYVELQDGKLKIREVYNYIAGIGELVEISSQKETIKGTVFDIADDWALLLRDESGIIKKFYYGDVKKLKW